MHRISRPGLVVFVLTALALIGAACSESTTGDDASSTSGADDTGSATSSDSGRSDSGGSDAEDLIAATGEFFGDLAAELGTMPVLTDPAADTVVERWAGQPWFIGDLPDTPVAAEGEPILLGMINQENELFGDFPELRQAAQAAVDWINTELGGVGGRPIELLSCNANFSPEESRQCALDHVRAGVPAVTGGINIMSANAVAVLEENDVPLLGGIPINDDEMVSDISFLWSGGSAGAFAAWSQYAVEELGAEKIAIAHADFDPITDAAERFGRDVAESLGAEVEMIRFPLTETDFGPTMNKVAEMDPDAVFVGVVDTGCIASIEAIDAVGLEIPRFFVGSCAAPEIADQLGEVIDGAIFSIESIIETDDPEIDRALYFDAVRSFGEEGMEVVGAGTVSFKNVMNIWDLMNELGPENVTPEAMIELAGQSEDRPSFMGHPYTCDGNQLPDLPAVCSPQQVLVQNQDGTLAQISDGWIDVSALFGE